MFVCSEEEVVAEVEARRAEGSQDLGKLRERNISGKMEDVCMVTYSDKGVMKGENSEFHHQT